MLDLKNAKSVLDHFIRLSSICFLLSSCSGPRQDDNLMENKNLYSIDLDHSTKERSFVFSSIFCDLETIILDSEEKVIGNIDKIQADDSTIYILDINISKGVFKYSHNGNYIQQIGNIGSGPGEYIKPFDLYDLETLELKKRIVGEYKLQQPTFKDEELYYVSAFAGKKYFYALFKGERNAEGKNPSNTIEVYDYDGNPVVRYRFDMPPLFFYPDEKNDCIYATHPSCMDTLLRYDL